MTPPLAILQARLNGTRLKHKMLQEIGGRALLWHGWQLAVSTFGSAHTVIACPARDVFDLQVAVPSARFFGWDGPEDDVLGRLWACAHHYRETPGAEIVRLTPDDFPLDLERDRTSLAQLDWWYEGTLPAYLREHVGYLFHPTASVEINTQADLDYVRSCVEQHQRSHRSAV